MKLHYGVCPVNRLGKGIDVAFHLALIAAIFVAVPSYSSAQEADVPPLAPKEAANYTPAIQLLPDTVAGLVRVPNLPRLRAAWKETNLGKLVEEESMKPFIEAQRARTKNYFESIGNKIGIRAEDLYDLSSGEVVLSWLPFEKDKRRPFAICAIADVRGKKVQTEQAVATIDKDLKAGGWVRQDVMHREQLIRVYNTKPKPGQLKVEQIAITYNDDRVIAADRDSVVTDLLDAVAGDPKGNAIDTLDDFKTVLTRSGQSMRAPIKEGGGTVAAEWFIQPFKMGRIIRESLDVDRGNQVDVIKLLENQGFDAIKAAGGIFAVAGQKYDLLHRGFILAPPTTKQPSRYEKAARILQFVNHPYAEIPLWVHEDTASFNRVHLRIEEAFWASETLINEAFGDEIFRDIIEGIRDDEDGPQIDIEKNVLPNLDDEIILLTDNTVPTALNSERMLVAIRVRDAEAIKLAIRKAMEVEPDASKMDVLPDVEIWRVQRGESEEDFDPELFGDLDLDFAEEETEKSAPLLDHWAIAVVDKGPGSDAGYLMFSSHPDLLVLSATRIQQGAEAGMGSAPSIQSIVESLKSLGCNEPAFDRVVRLKLSLRTKYELLREGKLKESDSIMAAIYRRSFEDEDGGQSDPLNAAKLPPLEEVEKYFNDGGSYFETTEDGWALTGFLLK